MLQTGEGKPLKSLIPPPHPPRHNWRQFRRHPWLPSPNPTNSSNLSSRASGQIRPHLTPGGCLPPPTTHTANTMMETNLILSGWPRAELRAQLTTPTRRKNKCSFCWKTEIARKKCWCGCCKRTWKCWSCCWCSGCARVPSPRGCPKWSKRGSRRISTSGPYFQLMAPEDGWGDR